MLQGSKCRTSFTAISNSRSILIEVRDMSRYETGLTLRVSFALSLCTVSVTANAWGSDGHKVVAQIAQSQLSPKAKLEVDRLLALEPGAMLETISTWADEHRNPTTAAWHYVNFPRDSCKYDALRDCSNGKCVVGAIEEQTAVLASNASDERRFIALKYLVHFVADVHQPLHAGYADDRGGNSYQLQAFMRGANLHSLWDSGLIKNLNLETNALTNKLLAMAAPAGGRDLNAVQAAEESCRIVGTEGFYPGRKVGVDYVEKFTPVVEQRLRLAGDRLAGLLNMVLK